MMVQTCTPAPELDAFGDEDFEEWSDWEDDYEPPAFEDVESFFSDLGEDLGVTLTFTQDAYDFMLNMDSSDETVME
jgi:hypothetical protein